MSTSLRPALSSLSVVVMLALAISLGLLFFTGSENKDSIKILDVNGSTNAPTIEIDSNEKTIATAWQWEEVTHAAKENSSATFSEATVYEALQHVRLDEQGNVIIDHEALIALNATLDNSRLQLDPQALSELQTIIRQGLPGKAGDDVAKIVADYYHFLEASKEFNSLYETDYSNAQAIENTTEEHEEIYRELRALRDLYLGSDTSSKLFSTTDANANYMFDMLKLENSTELSDEEKQQKRAEIMAQHAEQTINVSNWTERHSVFLAAKKNIIAAAISDQQKQTQLTELMHQHFNREELTHVSHLQLDKP
jgi:lipase chaperone LimK